jgi:ribosomal RNA-processing protein 9
VQASGAGDGAIRLWGVGGGGAGGHKSLAPLGVLPARGFVNGLAIARSGKFLVAAVGQEPRLGRWARDGKARNGALVHRIPQIDDA